MNWYVAALKKYAVFEGRAQRKEYWMFVLFTIIFGVIAIVLDNISGLVYQSFKFGIFYCLFSLAVLLPGLTVMVRRLHDIGKSGWMIFINLIPLIGSIWLLILLATDSQSGENQYGVNPKV